MNRTSKIIIVIVYSFFLVFWLSKIEFKIKKEVHKNLPQSLTISVPRSVFVKCFNECPPIDSLRQCFNDVSFVVIQELSPQWSHERNILEDIPYLCNWSIKRGLDPLLVSAVTRVESTWNRFDKTGPYGTGYMQVIGLHAKRHGLTRKDLLVPETNFRIGTEVMILHKATLKNPSGLTDYNGNATPGYRENVMRVYRKYCRILKQKEREYFPLY